MTHYITGCLAREDDYPQKPHPAAFEAMHKTHNLQRKETLMSAAETLMFWLDKLLEYSHAFLILKLMK